MSAEMMISLVIGIFGGGAGIRLIERFLDHKSGVKRLEKAMEEGFSTTDSKIERISNRFEEHKAVMARVRILRFADDVQAKKRHSKESFYQVLSDIDEYEDYCDLNPRFENNKTVIASKRIKDCYAERLEKNDFL